MMFRKLNLPILIILFTLIMLIPVMHAVAQDESVPVEGEAAPTEEIQPDAVQESILEEEPIITDAEPDITDTVPPGLLTARKCYQTYRSAMLDAAEGDTDALDRAMETLNLDDILEFTRNERGRELVVQLARIIDYSPAFDVSLIPNETDARPHELLSFPEGPITIGRDDSGAWRFTKETVEAIPEIYRSMELAGTFDTVDPSKSASELLSGGQVTKELGFRAMVPDSWKRRVLFLDIWEWLFLVLLILSGYIVYTLMRLIAGFILGFWFRSLMKNRDTRKLSTDLAKPVGLLALSLVWWLLIVKAGLHEGLSVTLLVIAKILLAFSIIWIFYRAVDIITEYIKYKSLMAGRVLDPSLAAFVSGTLKIIAFLIGVVLVLSNMGVNVTGLVAGLGIGGLAIALAAQSALENLLGSLVIFTDHPFKVGDYVVIDQLEGTVESVGFRSTRIRTFYNSIVTVPNGELAKIIIDNMGMRHLRRVKTTLAVTYGTPPEKMEAFCAGIRELIRLHPWTSKERYFVWFEDFGAASLDIRLVYHMNVQDFATEFRERHRMNLDIMRLAQHLGVEFAFPTQTIFMGKETTPPPIYPEASDIKTSLKQAINKAEEEARKIYESEMGGRHFVPDPFVFEMPDEDESMDPIR